MVRFGVAGYPPEFANSIYRKSRCDIIKWIVDLGLQAFEMQMTYGPRTSKDVCVSYRRLAEELRVSISIHASYYIVLTSREPDKIARSIDTLKRTFELADILGAEVVVLHPGPLYGEAPEGSLQRIKEHLTEFFHDIGSTDVGLFLETAGKVGQLGSIQEIFEVSRDLASVHPCIDFGHVHARTLGTLDNDAAIESVFLDIERFRSDFPAKKMHFHYTPINFGPRGEIGHKALEDTYPVSSVSPCADDVPARLYYPRFERIIEQIYGKRIDCTIISETLNSQERGAMAMRDHFYEISGLSIG